jgi:hypothetical protein
MGNVKLSLLMLFLLCSCFKQQESITPIAPVTTTAELQKEMMNKRALEAGNAELSYDTQAILLKARILHFFI